MRIFLNSAEKHLWFCMENNTVPPQEAIVKLHECMKSTVLERRLQLCLNVLIPSEHFSLKNPKDDNSLVEMATFLTLKDADMNQKQC